MKLQPLWLFFIVVILIVSGQQYGAAQTDTPPSEPDTETFIEENFQLQDKYSDVLCVAQSEDCPSSVQVAVPCLTGACEHPAQDYSVSQTFTTLQDAVTAAQPGNLVLIMPGQYRGVQVEDGGGEDGAYIHLLGWGDAGSVIVNGPADPDKAFLRHHFYFINAHHFFIQNILFEGSEEGAGLFFSGYFSNTGSFAHHFIVKDVYSRDNFEWGLHSTSASYILIEDSVFQDSQDEHGVYISGSGDNVVIRRNVFQGNNASGLQINADPQTATAEVFYWLQNSTGNTCGSDEEDVEFEGAATWHDLKTCYDSQGLPSLGEFFEDGISEHIFIEQNIATGNGRAGGGAINLASVRDTVVRNNLLYGNGAAAIACWDNAYAEEKGLPASDFGCQGVQILNNTMVDTAGNRGALILNNDAHNITVYNNIIIRDRFDAYEIANRSGSSLNTGHNYYFSRSEDNVSDVSPEIDSITGFTIDDGLAQFVNAVFAPWIIEDGLWYALNPDRPDYHLHTNSSLVMRGDPSFTPVLDLAGDVRITSDIGAFGSGDAQNISDADTPSSEDQPSDSTGAGTITFTLPDGHVYRMLAQAGSIPEDISAQLDQFGTGLDEWLNISPNGQWLLLSTERLHPDCAGWACLMVIDRDLTSPEIVLVNDSVIHVEGFSAITSDGNHIVYVNSDENGSHQLDLFVVSRQDSTWSEPRLLTGESPYQYHWQPAISDDGLHVVFNCGDESFGDSGICEMSINDGAFSVILTTSDGPPDWPNAVALHHPDYGPGGSIVFEGDWGGEQIWRYTPQTQGLQLINDAYTNDNSPCVLPDGRIVSLWLNRPEGEGFHEIKMMNDDGSGELMLLVNQDVFDVGLGCGGGG